MQRGLTILDSSLRDGAQSIGISFSIDDKLAIVRLLDNIGVTYIEAGNPSSNPKEVEFFERVKDLRLKHSKICAFSSTRRKNVDVREDNALNRLVNAGTQVCTIFGKSSRFHVLNVLETTLDENLSMIKESCEYVKAHGKELIYDAEHFFDGYKLDRDYALQTLKAAAEGGADLLCLCDTNGGVFPSEVEAIIADVSESIDMPIGVHFHDDSGVAVANSVQGVLAGAEHVQGTFIGFGERCGNANLAVIMGDLQLKLGISCIPEDKMKLLRRTAKGIAAVANIDLPHNMPYVGKYAFAHKAGMHADGVLKVPASFEHIDPELVGNSRRFPTSEISGRSIILEKINMIFPEAEINSLEVAEILTEIKALEQRGYQFEGADASFEILVRRKMKPFKPFFELLYYNINTEYNKSERSGASAIVKIAVGEKIQLMAAEGNGPVHALDLALRKALEVFYPAVGKVKLTDYKVRVLDGQNATASHVRVLITSTDGASTYTTVGVSDDVVAASWKALEDSIEYLLINLSEEENRMA